MIVQMVKKFMKAYVYSHFRYFKLVRKISKFCLAQSQEFFTSEAQK